jgi:hypothetical protein
LADLSGLLGDPLVSEGLIASGSRINWTGNHTQPPAGSGYGKDELPQFGKAAHLANWQPEVRAHICSTLLHERLRVCFTPGSGSKHPLVTLKCWTTQIAGGGSPSDQDAEHERVLVEISRPARAVFDEQVLKIISHARPDLRRARLPEVLTQVLPQVPYWGTLLPLSPWRTPWTWELIGVVLTFVMQIVHRFKHALAVSRPNEISARVQPVLLTPGWSALPSGHASEAFAFARLMRLLLQEPGGSELDNALQQQAKAIADNRVYAGLHYPVDGVAGRLLGVALAEYAAARCAGGVCKSRAFDGSATADLKSVDLELQHELDDPAAGKVPPFYKVGDLPGMVSTSSELAEMWRRASHEVQGLGFGLPRREER